MPRELITIQVGQCGNQVGCRFWDIALQEHAKYNTSGMFDDAMSSFFRNVDTRYEDPVEVGGKSGSQPVRSLKARAVLIDMEEGVVNNVMKSSLAELFDTRQFVTDVSGAGNNWAYGHDVYGPQYKEELLGKIRRTVEQCDSLQVRSEMGNSL
eukprot:GHVS01037995.1.p1 GENE.GHVS01037995.1~~GHVS01037995.1.p1  ORF type:complete len:153 (-),score=22.95 GHVS01037995.1:89-547(-)